MLAVMLLLSSFVEINMIWKVVLEFIVGVFVYFTTNYILLDKFQIEQTKNVFNKVLNIIKYSKKKEHNIETSNNEIIEEEVLDEQAK